MDNLDKLIMEQCGITFEDLYHNIDELNNISELLRAYDVKFGRSFQYRYCYVGEEKVKKIIKDCIKNNKPYEIDNECLNLPQGMTFF